MTKNTDSLPSRSSLQARIRECEDNIRSAMARGRDDLVAAHRKALVELRNMFHDVSGV